MRCTRVELTGCGSVATAPASASSIAAIRSGENEAFEKSFIRCVQFAVVRERVSRQPAGRPHVPNLRRTVEQIMRGDHYTASLGDAPRVEPHFNLAFAGADARQPRSQTMDVISASSFPALITSPTAFPSIALARGETCEIDPLAGSASSSPTIRKVCSRPSSRTIVTVVPSRASEVSPEAGTSCALARRTLQYLTSRAAAPIDARPDEAWAAAYATRSGPCPDP